MRIICPKCRNVIEDDTARFCSKCGTDLLAATEGVDYISIRFVQ